MRGRPEELLRRAVMGMLPKNKLRDRMILQLRIYEGPSHPHAADLRGKGCLLGGAEAAAEAEGPAAAAAATAAAAR
jgi:Ribosomal protein L13